MWSSNSPSSFFHEDFSGLPWKSHSTLGWWFFHEGRKLSLKCLVYQWLTRPQTEGSIQAGLKHGHRFPMPEGCRSWCCRRGFCVPTDSGHLEVFHTTWSKIHTFSTTATCHFIPSKGKAGRYHTCTVGNSRWSHMCNCRLPFFIAHYRVFINFLTLFSTKDGLGSMNLCVVCILL